MCDDIDSSVGKDVKALVRIVDDSNPYVNINISYFKMDGRSQEDDGNVTGGHCQ